MNTKPMLSEAVLGEINRAAIPLSFDPEDYDPLLDWIGTRRVVLLGEASHGTHDFYRERAAITRRLIEEKGFNAIAIEGDWPDAHRVHRFVTGRGPESNARDALAGFQRFPAWMWRNMDVLAFLDWLHAFNSSRPRTEKVGFYGLDLYSLHASMRAVLDYLDKVDPKAAERARSRYECFDRFGEDAQAYGYGASFDLDKSCTDEAVAQLVEMERRSAELALHDGRVDPEDYLTAEQNARLVQNAEHYYRTMFAGGAEAWNVRDQHMSNTLEWLLQVRPAAKVVVWAHNSHLGDARGSEMAGRGEINLGQLARERYGEEVFTLGFTTHSGEVTAASAWDQPAERRIVRPALRDSYEALFHDTQIPVFLLPMHDKILRQLFDRPRLQRAIGVVYAPEAERASHYFRARMSAQFDAVVHIDRTKALVPFERTATWASGETAETYPYAV